MKITTIIILGLLVLLTIFYIVYYFLNKENKDEIISNEDIQSLPNTIIINKKRKLNVKPTIVSSSIPKVVSSSIPKVVSSSIPIFLSDVNSDIVENIISRYNGPKIIYRNENNLYLDPTDHCFIKSKFDNRNYTGYIEFNTEQNCIVKNEDEDEDENEDEGEFNVYPNVRGYVSDGSIEYDFAKKVSIGKNWYGDDIINYYPKSKLNDQGILLTDIDKIIFQYRNI